MLILYQIISPIASNFFKIRPAAPQGLGVEEAAFGQKGCGKKMVLYLGDKELYDFMSGLCDDISTELPAENAGSLIVAEYSHNAVSVVRAAVDKDIPVLGVLDGYRTVVEAYGGECIPIENCPEGKQELAVLDTTIPIYKGLEHVMSICRGNPSAADEERLPPELDCIARSEAGDIIAVSDAEHKSVFAVNYYLNSSLTRGADKIIMNFLNLTPGE